VTWEAPVPALTPTLVISPRTGPQVAAQAFDLALIGAGSLSVAGGSATFDGVDVTAALGACVVPGVLPAGGVTFMCPGLSGGLLGAGHHALHVTLTLSDRSTVGDLATWGVVGNREP
jgi:hypothetical protein